MKQLTIFYKPKQGRGNEDLRNCSCQIF